MVLVPAAAAAIAVLLKRRRCPRCGRYLTPPAHARGKRPHLHQCPDAPKKPLKPAKKNPRR